MNQTVRIIGGKYRGKKFTFPLAEGLRPTSDRIRETVFNWLMQDIQGSACLDAFAGSGALGIEAFSRGASPVVLIEQNPAVYAHLKKNLACFGEVPLKLIKGNALEFMQTAKAQFDIVFLDPPYSQNLLSACLEILGKSAVLKNQGLVYLEAAEVIVPNESAWEVIKEKRAGQVFYALLRKR